MADDNENLGLSPNGSATPPVNVNITPVAVLEDRRKKKKAASTRGFDMRDDGLWADADGLWVHLVAPPFNIVARTASYMDDCCGLVLNFKGERSGIPKEVEIKRADLILGRGSPLCAMLADEGLHFLNPSLITRFIAYLSQATPAELRMVAGPPGWTKNGDFALPDAIYGKDKQTTLVTVHGVNKYRTKGTLEDWQKNIASLAVGNWRSIVGISASFAGPLLKLLGSEGFVLHTPGLSSKGKTTNLQVAASVWGRPDKSEEGNIIFGNLTSNSIEGVAERCNDTGGYLDEAGMLQELFKAIFNMAEGTGKMRLTRAAVLREARHWTSIFQTTANDTLNSLLREATPRQRASGGQAVRAIELPPAQDEGCFEELHGYSDSGAFAEYLRAMALSYYGVAGRMFLTRFVPRATEGHDELDGRVKEFAEQLCVSIKSSSGQVRRIAQKIGLIAVAGELATYLGITGWNPGMSEEAAKIAFKGIIWRRGGTGDHEVEFGVRAVKEFIERGIQSRFVETRRRFLEGVPAGRPVIHNIAGHIIEVKIDAAQECIFAFTSNGFEEACGGSPAKDVAKELLRRKLLAPGEGVNLARKVPLSNIVAGERGERYRRYCVLDRILHADLDKENSDG